MPFIPANERTLRSVSVPCGCDRCRDWTRRWPARPRSAVACADLGLAVAACLLAGLGVYQLHNSLQVLATQMAPAAHSTAVSIFAACFFMGQTAGVCPGAWMVRPHSAPTMFVDAGTVLPLIGWVFSRQLGGQAGLH